MEKMESNKIDWEKEVLIGRKSLIIKPDGTVTATEPENGYTFGLGELQQIVGGLIEIIPFNNVMSLVVNEEGSLLHLPLNPNASQNFGIELRGCVLLCLRSRIE